MSFVVGLLATNTLQQVHPLFYPLPQKAKLKWGNGGPHPHRPRTAAKAPVTCEVTVTWGGMAALIRTGHAPPAKVTVTCEVTVTWGDGGPHPHWPRTAAKVRVTCEVTGAWGDGGPHPHRPRTAAKVRVTCEVTGAWGDGDACPENQRGHIMPRARKDEITGFPAATITSITAARGVVRSFQRSKTICLSSGASGSTAPSYT